MRINGKPLELWTVLTVENLHYDAPIITYPSWRAAYIAASRYLGWKDIVCIFKAEEGQ
jgi:hypothetical protein